MKTPPIRQQYLRIKKKYPEVIVLFRLGDFYETFDDDAVLVSRILEITLTSREMGKGNKVPLAGIPYHALDNYLGKLIGHGYKVAICEQLTPPGKGLVERDVVRVVTPGTIVEPGLLEGTANNYLAGVLIEGDRAGLAYVDITTAEFATAQLPLSDLLSELGRLTPSELVCPVSGDYQDLAQVAAITKVDDYWFDAEMGRQSLLDHFGVATLEGYGCDHLPLAVGAASAILQYLQQNQKQALALLTSLSTYSTDKHMVLDLQTRRNLDLFVSNRRGTVFGTLLSVIDLTQTSMGSRLLKKWVNSPLLDLAALVQRQDAVEMLYEYNLVRGKLIALLRQATDLERLANRVRNGQASPKELVSLKRTLGLVPEVRGLLEDAGAPGWLRVGLYDCSDVVELIASGLSDDPPATIDMGGAIRENFSVELDQLRTASKQARQFLANLERQERERTGIKSLKVSYNKVFGYYIEISNANLAAVPDDYIRKQTLVGGERFFTMELKEYESLILNAQDKIAELESSIFRQICRQVSESRDNLMSTAAALAQLDVFCSLAEVAVRNDYRRPQLTDGDTISIKGGRHPVVEVSLKDVSFIPNDTYLSNKETQIILLTGPNMAGKSTYLRQVALIVLLAQLGSFIPAESATLGIVDRIFTRIGAQEDLAAGQSTFMVEMVETANILNNATGRSLIILDEIGRGTSTYDGMSIAHAVVEYLHSQPGLGSKTLFATHYHELVDLAAFLPRVKNYNVAVTEERGQVVFLHKIVPGGADKSYGIHVAQLAGLPKSVLNRARDILSGLENGSKDKPSRKSRNRPSAQDDASYQLVFFGQPPAVLQELLALEMESLTPLEALNKLYELQRKAREDEK